MILIGTAYRTQFQKFHADVMLTALPVNESATRDRPTPSLPKRANALDPEEEVTNLAGAFDRDEAGFTLQGMDLHPHALKPQPIAVD